MCKRYTIDRFDLLDNGYPTTVEEICDKLNNYEETITDLKIDLYKEQRKNEKQFKKYHDLNMKRYNAIRMIEELLINLKTSYYLTDREGLKSTFEKLQRTLEDY